MAEDPALEQLKVTLKWVRDTFEPLQDCEVGLALTPLIHKRLHEAEHAGYRAGLEAAVKALEEWRDKCAPTGPFPDWEAENEFGVAHNWRCSAVEVLRALLEEKP